MQCSTRLWIIVGLFSVVMVIGGILLYVHQQRRLERATKDVEQRTSGTLRSGIRDLDRTIQTLSANNTNNNNNKHKRSTTLSPFTNLTEEEERYLNDENEDNFGLNDYDTTDEFSNDNVNSSILGPITSTTSQTGSIRQRLVHLNDSFRNLLNDNSSTAISTVAPGTTDNTTNEFVDTSMLSQGNSTIVNNTTANNITSTSANNVTNMTAVPLNLCVICAKRNLQVPVARPDSTLCLVCEELQKIAQNGNIVNSETNSSTAVETNSTTGTTASAGKGPISELSSIMGSSLSVVGNIEDRLKTIETEMLKNLDKVLQATTDRIAQRIDTITDKSKNNNDSDNGNGNDNNNTNANESDTNGNSNDTGTANVREETPDDESSSTIVTPVSSSGSSSNAADTNITTSTNNTGVSATVKLDTVETNVNNNSSDVTRSTTMIDKPTITNDSVGLTAALTKPISIVSLSSSTNEPTRVSLSIDDIGESNNSNISTMETETSENVENVTASSMTENNNTSDGQAITLTMRDQENNDSNVFTNLTSTASTVPKTLSGTSDPTDPYVGLSEKTSSSIDSIGHTAKRMLSAEEETTLTPATTVATTTTTTTMAITSNSEPLFSESNDNTNSSSNNENNDTISDSKLNAEMTMVETDTLAHTETIVSSVANDNSRDNEENHVTLTDLTSNSTNNSNTMSVPNLTMFSSDPYALPTITEDPINEAVTTSTVNNDESNESTSAMNNHEIEIKDEYVESGKVIEERPPLSPVVRDESSIIDHVTPIDTNKEEVSNKSIENGAKLADAVSADEKSRLTEEFSSSSSKSSDNLIEETKLENVVPDESLNPNKVIDEEPLGQEGRGSVEITSETTISETISETTSETINNSNKSMNNMTPDENLNLSVNSSMSVETEHGKEESGGTHDGDSVTTNVSNSVGENVDHNESSETIVSTNNSESTGISNDDGSTVLTETTSVIPSTSTINFEHRTTGMENTAENSGGDDGGILDKEKMMEENGENEITRDNTMMSSSTMMITNPTIAVSSESAENTTTSTTDTDASLMINETMNRMSNVHTVESNEPSTTSTTAPVRVRRNVSDSRRRNNTITSGNRINANNNSTDNSRRRSNNTTFHPYRRT